MKLLERNIFEYDRIDDYIKETRHSYKIKLSKSYSEYDYVIGKDKVGTKDELLWWIAQLSSKGITDPHAIYFFIESVCKNTGIDFGR